jgi:hypothetical protein
VSCETKVIVKGCPTPSEKPAIKTIAPKIQGFGAKAIATQAIIETTFDVLINLYALYRLLSEPKKYLDAIDVAARIEMITPIENAENSFSLPYSGRNTTRISAADETASEVKIAAKIPGFFSNFPAARTVPASWGRAATVAL